MDEYKFLLKRYLDKKIKYPYKVIIKHNPKTHGGALSTEYTVDNRKELLQNIREIEQKERGFYKCTFCDKYFKEDKGGRFLPMDKRELGDGLFGHAFCCYKCVPKEYGRL